MFINITDSWFLWWFCGGVLCQREKGLVKMAAGQFKIRIQKTRKKTVAFFSTLLIFSNLYTQHAYEQKLYK